VLREFPLPAALAEQARAWAGSPPGAVAVPRQAATVLLVRDGDAGVEVFLLRRRLSMAFAAGMCVFPGGGVDPRDTADAVPWAGPDAAAWGLALGCPPGQARGLVCAAVRETFEECGVLLAGEAGGAVLGAADGSEWEAERRRLLSRKTAMSDLLRRRGLVLRSDLLRAWAHWTTPVHEPRRFQTWFLVAVVPEGQSARHVGGESDESGWWPAAVVLDRVARGEVSMLPPTLVTVEEVAAAPSAAALWREARTVREVVPVLRWRGDALVLVADLPDQPAAAAPAARS
jgi:8-oxo-dGTP pyrophosphatase MutT (NUDIX family)